MRHALGGSKPCVFWGVTSGARQEFSQNFLTMAKIGHRLIGVRNRTLWQLFLCYYLFLYYETVRPHRQGYGLCGQRVWWSKVLTRWRFCCQTSQSCRQNSDLQKTQRIGELADAPKATSRELSGAQKRQWKRVMMIPQWRPVPVARRWL